jgi:hypothetical protein
MGRNLVGERAIRDEKDNGGHPGEPRERRGTLASMRDLSILLPWLRDPDPEPEADPLTAAYARGQAEAEATYRRRLAALRIEASAMGRLIDPGDAVAYIDAAEFDPEDEAGITGAITALIEAKPHLAVPRDPEPPHARGDDLRRR